MIVNIREAGHRTELDPLGEIFVADHCLYGAQTERDCGVIEAVEALEPELAENVGGLESGADEEATR